MQRITDPTVATTLPAASSTGSPGFFTDGNPAAAIAATIVTEDWLNGVQEELVGAIEASGQTPSITNNAQLLAAILTLPSGRLLGVQIFDTPGTFTYTPEAGTNSVEVEVQGAGGAAAGSPATTSGQTSAGGGGSGAWAWKRITSGFSGVTITVGDGGVGVSGGDGGNGQASSFGALVAANGGSGGQTGGPAGAAASFNAPAGFGGAQGTSGNINAAGNTGNFGIVSAGNGIPLPGVPGRFLAQYGSGGGPNTNPTSAAAQTGGGGGGGIVIIREYS
jgi:hypothetical protein